jgi:hypothetical protein
MNDYLFPRPAGREKSRVRYGLPARNSAGDGFTCVYCHAYVSTHPILSGVENRNHCLFCLWSRHLDLYAAGDRLSACKALMQPVGLTVKATYKKYGPARGELMIIHACSECEKLSINRIAADDDPQTAFNVFEGSFHLETGLQIQLELSDIRVLKRSDHDAVRTSLFGQADRLVEAFFKSNVLEFD